MQALVNGQVVAKTNGLAGQAIKLPIEKPRLWSPADPFLYDLKVILKKNNKKLDEVTSYFGMRKIEVKKDSKGIELICLNGKPIFNLGVLDQGFWPEGVYTAPTDSALWYDVDMMKKMGFNCIRKYIKVEPARWYYHCNKWPSADVADMHFYCYPSVFPKDQPGKASVIGEFGGINVIYQGHDWKPNQLWGH